MGSPSPKLNKVPKFPFEILNAFKDKIQVFENIYPYLRNINFKF